MANSFRPSGQVSPTMFSRTLERVFEDAQHTGEINLSGRNLKEYSNIAEKFDLVDTTTVGEFLCNHPDVQFRLSSLQWVSLISKSPRIAANRHESPRIAVGSTAVRIIRYVRRLLCASQGLVTLYLPSPQRVHDNVGIDVPILYRLHKGGQLPPRQSLQI